MRLLFLELILFIKKLPKLKIFFSRLLIILGLDLPFSNLLLIFFLVKTLKIFYAKTKIFIINKDKYNNML